MTVQIAGETYYHTLEAVKKANISRATLMRWIEKGITRDAAYRDRRGWRLFKESEVDLLVKEARKIQH